MSSLIRNGVIEPIEQIGEKTVAYLQRVGAWGIFLFRSFYSVFVYPFRFYFIAREIRIIGFESLSIIIFTGFFYGNGLGC